MNVEPHETLMRVTRLIRDTMQIEFEDIDTDLIETGLIDSLALVDMIFLLEREFGISIGLDEISIDSFRTVRSIGGLLSGLAVDARSDPA